MFFFFFLVAGAHARREQSSRMGCEYDLRSGIGEESGVRRGISSWSAQVTGGHNAPSFPADTSLWAWFWV